MNDGEQILVARFGVFYHATWVPGYENTSEQWGLGKIWRQHTKISPKIGSQLKLPNCGRKLVTRSSKCQNHGDP